MPGDRKYLKKHEDRHGMEAAKPADRCPSARDVRALGQMKTHEANETNGNTDSRPNNSVPAGAARQHTRCRQLREAAPGPVKATAYMGDDEATGADASAF